MRLYYDRDEIAAFVKDGADREGRVRIAAQMNCCKVSVILDICKSYGLQITLPKQKRGRKSILTPGKIHQVQEALRLGTKRCEIAKAMGVSDGTITYWAKKLNIEKAPK